MRKIISFLLAMCMVFTLGITAFADGNVSDPGSEPDSVVEPRAEQLEWVFRVINGNLEKRLWSNTYGVWRTDWIYVCPYTG